MVQGCTRTKQTFWTEDQCTVTVSSGIRDHDMKVAEIVVRELEKTRPDKWGYVQTGETGVSWTLLAGESGVSWTLLAAEVWEGSWNQQMCREGVQVGYLKVRGGQGSPL